MSSSLPPPLSAERVAEARVRHGHAVDLYLKYLRLGDPILDALVLHDENVSASEGYNLFYQALHYGIDSVKDPSPPLVELFKELDCVPFWVDWNRMRISSKKIIRNGLLACLSFATYALPHVYLATCNKPLALTGLLFEQTPRRFAQTARFVIDIFMPDGLERYSDGFRSVALVRYRHALSRHRMLNSSEWSPDSYELPMNQAHMAVTSIFFSVYVVRGLQRLGMRFTPQEMESILLTWRYVCYLLGVNPEIVSASEEDADRLIDVAFSLEFDPDENSKRLFWSMVKAGPHFMGFKNMGFKKSRIEDLFSRLVCETAFHLLDERLTEYLDFPPKRSRFLFLCLLLGIRCWDRMPWLFPRSVRHFLGIRFWLERAEFEEFGNV